MNIRSILQRRHKPNNSSAETSKEAQNRQVAKIHAQNARTLERIDAFRARKESYDVFNTLKHKYPYFGLVPCRAGAIEFVLFHANDDQIAWEYQWFGPDKYETDIVATWLRWCQDARIVLDIGGYTGLMSILAGLANNKTEIHLFEPTPRTIERAKMNVRVNGLADKIKLHNKAVSNVTGTSRINLYREENFVCSGNSLIDTGAPVCDTKIIDTVAVDTYLSSTNPTAVKIDVEGHELQCLEGMIQTIKRARPKMLIEVWEHNRKDVLCMLSGLGYQYEAFESQDRRVMNFRFEPT